MSHTHQCWSCRDHWEHDEDRFDCVGQQFVPCPLHEGEVDEPWHVERRPLGVPAE